MSATNQIDHARLLEILNYAPETGEFYWLTSPKHNIPAGSRAGGNMMNGYSFTKINGQFYTLHKLAVFYMTKAWPIGHVDHINGVRNDNRCSNLRVVNRSQNSLNRKVYATNTSGFKGVNWHPRLRKWRVRIQKEGKRVALGCFASLEDARVAYTRAEKEYYGEFARGAHKPCKT